MRLLRVCGGSNSLDPFILNRKLGEEDIPELQLEVQSEPLGLCYKNQSVNVV
jgi:hypothetical protein